MRSFAENPLGLPKLARDLVQIMEQMRKLHGAALRVISELDHADAACSAGYSSLSALISDLVHVTPRRASRLIAQAGLVAEVVTPTGHLTPARLPLVRDALRDGVLDPDHVDAIADVVKKIPAWAPADTSEIIEKHLVDVAREAHPSVVRTHGETLLARIDPDGDQPTSDSLAEPKNVFRYRRDQTGWMHFTGTIEPETAEELDAMLGALAKPDDPADERHQTQRLGDAFCDVVHHAVTSPDLPTRGGEKPHLNATMDYSLLLAGIGTGALEGGALLSAAAARRIACDCGVVPVVMNGSSVPLDVGRTRRLVTPKQRVALNARDGGCTFPNCGRPARWSDAHHITSWLDGGATDLNNLVLLCRRHHRIIHHSEWMVRIRNDGLPEFIPPRWIDPCQAPRRNVLHQRGKDHRQSPAGSATRTLRSLARHRPRVGPMLPSGMFSVRPTAE
jgi:hypothetical protein